MVGVPVLFCACDSACVPLVWVMAVGVGVSGWCVFQWCVAVVWASRRVPGVFWVWLGWLVSGVSGVCAWVAGVGESVWWFRMLTCLASFFFLVLSLVLFC